MNRQNITEKYYNAIMESNCADEFKEMVNRLHVFLKNKREYRLQNVSLPCYLWVAKRGGGISTLLKVLSEYLYAARAIEFCGTVKSFEFKLDYINPESHLSELSRLDNTVAGYAGHNRYFKGICCININEWIDHTDEDHFKTILEYAFDNKDNLFIVFCIHAEDNKTIEFVESAISSHMRVETLIPKFPDACELVDFIESRLKKDEGFFFTDNAKILLNESVQEIIESRYFNGFKTITQLAEKIMFEILSGGSISNKQITSEMLSVFSKNSAYIKQVMEQKNSNRIIGFSCKEV